MIPAFIDRASLPHRPGVYLYKNKQGEVIYVGKAVDLYSRVASYFNQSHQDNKTAALVKSIGSCQTIEVSSEIEALILEANLIKKYKPLFNIKLTDDKDYLYIKITKQPFPQILTARRNDLADASDYFGPFPSAKTVKTTLKKLRRVFPWCSNPPNGKNTAHRACFYYHLGQCPGACVGLIEQNDYRRIIHRFAKFMDGNFQQLQEELQNQMNELAQHQQYEQASQVKKILEGLNYLTQSSSIEGYLEEPNYLQNQNKLALQTLQEALKLPNLPERIECFDISNTGGQQAVGSLVVLTHGEIDKKWYRKFKIRLPNKPNDVGMMKEVIGRRLQHPEWPKPDLMIVDGGKGQLSGAWQVLSNSQWQVPIFGLAKRREWVIPLNGSTIKISHHSPALKLLQKIRDEAHRVAISFHRKLRAQAFVNSK